MSGVSGFVLTALPVPAGVAALVVGHAFVDPAAGLGAALRGAAVALVPATLAFGLTYALLLLIAVRLLSLGLREGTPTPYEQCARPRDHNVRSGCLRRTEPSSVYLVDVLSPLEPFHLLLANTNEFQIGR